jgi:uncharacterized coiled-coil protein SlyX
MWRERLQELESALTAQGADIDELDELLREQLVVMREWLDAHREDVAGWCAAHTWSCDGDR